MIQALKFAPAKGIAPRIEQRDLGDLLIDKAYQRMIEGKQSQDHIRNIAENWDWRLLSPLTVSHRDGSYGAPGFFVIDGQHRLEAARLRGDISSLPCMISRFESFEAEAMAFVNINSARRQVTALDRYHARIAAGEEKALHIKEIVEAADLKVTRYNDAELWTPGEIAFPDIVGNALSQESREVGATETALAFLHAWQGKVLLQGKDIFGGLLHITRTPWPEDCENFYEEFLNHIASKRQSQWISARNVVAAQNEDLNASQAMAFALLNDFDGIKPDLVFKGRPAKSPIAKDLHQSVPNKNSEVTPFQEVRSESAGTRYPETVRNPNADACIFKSGLGFSGIGAQAKIGIWKDMPIYVLALEERKSCPESCKVIDVCNGNQRPYIQRYRHGLVLENKIKEELQDLQALHPQGFVINLHYLGDFYSEAYVDLWEQMLNKFPALNIFGFTAHDISQPIGSKLLTLAATHWTRFAMRFSGSGISEMASLVIRNPQDCPDTAFICKAQTGHANNCATCGACWEDETNVAFIKQVERKS